MYKIISCDHDRITLRYILPVNDPDPPPTISFRISNEDNLFSIGDIVKISLTKISEENSKEKT